MRVTFVKAFWPTRTNETVNLTVHQHLVECRSVWRLGHFDIIGQINLDLFRSTRRVHATTHPMDVGWFYPIVILKNASHPDICRQLIFRNTDAASFEVFGAIDAFVRPDVNRGVAEGARQEDRNCHIVRFFSCEFYTIGRK